MLEVLNKGGIFNSGARPLMCSLKWPAGDSCVREPSIKTCFKSPRAL